jgi:hypothetical protein
VQRCWRRFSGLPDVQHSEPQRSQANPETIRLRPPVRLSVERAAMARDLRRQNPGMAVAAIAKRIGASDLEAVTRALGTLRTPLAKPRALLNCSEAAKVFVRTQAQPGESVGGTLDRLLGELVQLRG